MKTSRVLVVIPTFNCRNEVLELLADLKKVEIPSDTIFWFIDNLSSDGTFEVIVKFITDNRLKNVHSFQALQNNSLGGTHKIGFNEAIRNGYDYVAVLHGDNQANLADLISIIGISRSDKLSKSYLGSRFSKSSKRLGYSRKRLIGNVILNSIYSFFKLRKLVDLGSGLNVYRVKDLQLVSYLNFGDSLTFNYELILSMVDLNLPFEYVPIEWRESQQVSNAKNVHVFSQGILILTKNILRMDESKVDLERVYDVAAG